jgi:hypothetical protein
MASGILQVMKTLRASGVDIGANALCHKRTACTLLAHRASHALLLVRLRASFASTALTRT